MCTFQRCCARFTDFVHVAQPPETTFVFNCIHTERILTSKSIEATKHVLPICRQYIHTFIYHMDSLHVRPCKSYDIIPTSTNNVDVTPVHFLGHRNAFPDIQLDSFPHGLICIFPFKNPAILGYFPIIFLAKTSDGKTIAPFRNHLHSHTPEAAAVRAARCAAPKMELPKKRQ